MSKTGMDVTTKIFSEADQREAQKLTDHIERSLDFCAKESRAHPLFEDSGYLSYNTPALRASYDALDVFVVQDGIEDVNDAISRLEEITGDPVTKYDDRIDRILKRTDREGRRANLKLAKHSTHEGVTWSLNVERYNGEIHPNTCEVISTQMYLDRYKLHSENLGLPINEKAVEHIASQARKPPVLTFENFGCAE